MSAQRSSDGNPLDSRTISSPAAARNGRARGAGMADDAWWYIPEYARRRWDLECISIPNTLRLAAERDPHAEALVDGDGRRTYAELNEDMHRSVRAVLALGIEPGDRVALWGPNSGRWILAALGIHGAGGVLVPINTRVKGAEAAYVLRKSGA